MRYAAVVVPQDWNRGFPIERQERTASDGRDLQMTNLKDQIQQKIIQEQGDARGQAERQDVDDARERLDGIRPRLDELSHTTDEYRLKVEYVKGPYAADIAVLELSDANGVWVAMWQIATTVGGSVKYWEVTYNPHGIETQHEWFRDSDDLFKYLTTSIAERVVEMSTVEE